MGSPVRIEYEGTVKGDEIAGGVAIVTGGASGIGSALGRHLARRGALVVLADRDGEDARAEAARVTAAGGRCEAARLDVRDAAAAEALVADVFARHGRLDYLFNNAGIAVGGEARDLRLEDWRDAVEVNLMGVVHGVHATWPRMVAQGFGHVVNTASMAAFMATAMASPYGATKAAIVGLSRALRIEGAALGVRVSVLCPGVIRTPILENGGRHGRVRALFDAETQKRLWEQLRPMDVDVFARKALDDVARNREVIVHPAWWRLLRLLNGVAPSLMDALARRELAKIRARRER
jgi:NAD(P)-dependent dehydrogenase (short-subunit alcohol dehydrogenase family)